MNRVDLPHQDALVVTLQVGNFEVKRILIEPMAGANIIFLHVLICMELMIKDVIKN